MHWGKDQAVPRCASNQRGPISAHIELMLPKCLDMSLKMITVIIAFILMDVFAGQAQIQAISFMILLSNIYDTVLIAQTFIQSIVVMNVSH